MKNILKFSELYKFTTEHKCCKSDVLLNGMDYPVFYEGDAEFWAKNEADAGLQTEPGKTHQFTIPTDSVSKTKQKQVKDHGEGAPLGAIAIDLLFF